MVHDVSTVSARKLQPPPTARKLQPPPTTRKRQPPIYHPLPGNFNHHHPLPGSFNLHPPTTLKLQPPPAARKHQLFHQPKIGTNIFQTKCVNVLSSVFNWFNLKLYITLDFILLFFEATHNIILQMAVITVKNWSHTIKITNIIISMIIITYNKLL